MFLSSRLDQALHHTRGDPRTFRLIGGIPTYVLTDNEKTVTTMHIAGSAEGKTQKDVLRCLKRTIAREALTRPQVMDTTATEGQRLADEQVRRHGSLTRAAQVLNTYPAKISDIEKHRRPIPILTDQYKKWLDAA